MMHSQIVKSTQCQVQVPGAMSSFGEDYRVSEERRRELQHIPSFYRPELRVHIDTIRNGRQIAYSKD